MKSKVEPSWCCYLLLCEKNGSIYCGITNNLGSRIKKHEEGKGAKYTRSRGPFRLLAVRTGLTRSRAGSLEAMTKKQKRENKVRFLKTFVKSSC